MKGRKSSDSPYLLAWHRLKKNLPAMVGLTIIILAILVALFGYWFAPDNTTNANRQTVEIRLKKPGFSIDMLKVPLAHDQANNWWGTLIGGKSLNYRYVPILDHEVDGNYLKYHRYIGSMEGIADSIPLSQLDIGSSAADAVVHRRYWLGSDLLGRDFLSRLLLGTRVSITVGIMAVMIALIIGISLGSIAGYFRGWVDDVIMYIINVFWAIPTLLLALAFSLVMSSGLHQVYLAIGLTMWIDVARMVRGQVLVTRELEYVQATHAMAFSHFRIIVKHILPNIVGPIMVVMASTFASAILLEAGLSFLGLGIQRPMPSWGMMLSENRNYLIAGLPHLAVLPGLAISLLVLSFFMLGNGLRDAFDVKSKMRF